jgi:hypothetical protein
MKETGNITIWLQFVVSLSYMAYSSLMMEAVCSSEGSVIFRNTHPEDETHHFVFLFRIKTWRQNRRCFNRRSLVSVERVCPRTRALVDNKGPSVFQTCGLLFERHVEHTSHQHLGHKEVLFSVASLCGHFRPYTHKVPLI